MTAIIDHNELIRNLKRDVQECGKEKVVVQAGHFPLLYLPGGAVEGIDEWGVFSPYSLEIGCEIGKFARDAGREVAFVFFADDHSYQYKAAGKQQVRVGRRDIYRSLSGRDAQLNPVYKEIMGRFGFNEDDVLRHDQGKKGREDCLYFSELTLRDSGRDIDNACAREYVAFIENPRYYDLDNSYLISFVPNRCKGHVCDVALDEEVEGLSASHVFMDTMNPLASRHELYEQGRGVSYRRDS